MLKKKAAYEQKYSTLKTDFKLLFEQFEQSEAIRADQKEMIDNLKLQVSKLKKHTQSVDGGQSKSKKKSTKK